MYDLSYYMGLYPDLGTYVTKTTNYGSFVDDTKALRHFIDYGMAEGRRGCESFDVQSYYNEYFDLRRAYGSDLKSYYLHYLDYGMAEGRHGTGCDELANPISEIGGVDYSPVYDLEPHPVSWTRKP